MLLKGSWWAGCGNDVGESSLVGQRMDKQRMEKEIVLRRGMERQGTER